MQDVAYAVKAETEHAKRILTAVQDVIDGDEQAAHDVVEGETNLLEAIDRALVRLGEIEGRCIGLKAHVEGCKARIERFENGEERIRKSIKEAMEAIGQKKIERDLGTLSLRAKPQAVLEYDLAIVPEQYWVPQPPKLDKKLASFDLKSGLAVPGLGLSEPALSLQIR